MCSLSPTSTSSGSSLSIESKLKRIWKKVRQSNPLLASLVDIDKMTDTGTQSVLEKISLNTDDIMKELGTPIIHQLLIINGKHFIQLSANTTTIYAELRSVKDNEECINNKFDEEESPITEPLQGDLDESSGLEKTMFNSINWPNTVYSVVKTALENFSNQPRHSKEACILHAPSSIIESALAITRGEILSIKIYRSFTYMDRTSFYHFGVYVGYMVTKEGDEIQDAVIHLVQNSKTGVISIDAVPLAGDKKGKCFVLEKTNSGHPPLLFKVKYKGRTQKEKDETADSALRIYENSDYYVQKYSLISNNCEHFVKVCAFGIPNCEQHATFIMTTTPNFFKIFPTVSRIILMVTSQGAEIIVQSSKHILTYLGESVALGMLVAECVLRIVWDIYLLKKSGHLTKAKVLYILKHRLLPMAPELLVAVGFLLVAVLSVCSGPVGIIVGISGTILLLLLRFLVRPRIERWIERCEIERREDFRHWHPEEVARLAMEISEEDDMHEDILSGFASKQLSGETIIDLVNQERENPSEKPLTSILQQFLDPIRLEKFKKNVKDLLGHFDISEHLKSSIKLMYNNCSLTIDISDTCTIKASQVLDMAKLNWETDFAKGRWQLTMIDSENGNKTVVASHAMDNPLQKKICMIPDSSTTVKLTYEKPNNRYSCVLN